MPRQMGWEVKIDKAHNAHAANCELCSDEGFTDKTDNCRLLWSSVCAQAVEDLKAERGRPRRSIPDMEDKRDRAKKYLASPNTGIGTFRWITEQLGIDTKKALTALNLKPAVR